MLLSPLSLSLSIAAVQFSYRAEKRSNCTFFLVWRVLPRSATSERNIPVSQLCRCLCLWCCSSVLVVVLFLVRPLDDLRVCVASIPFSFLLFVLTSSTPFLMPTFPVCNRFAAGCSCLYTSRGRRGLFQTHTTIPYTLFSSPRTNHIDIHMLSFSFVFPQLSCPVIQFLTNNGVLFVFFL